MRRDLRRERPRIVLDNLTGPHLFTWSSACVRTKERGRNRFVFLGRDSVRRQGRKTEHSELCEAFSEVGFVQKINQECKVILSAFLNFRKGDGQKEAKKQ